MNITVFGSGYVGLVAAAGFAEKGHSVICVDVDANRVAQLQQGQIPLYEPGLADLLRRQISVGRLHYTTNAVHAIQHSTLYFIAVGTPSDKEGSADLQYVLQVAETIGRHMEHNALVVDKSTVPVGTGDKVAHILQQQLALRRINVMVDVVSNPEFLREGSALNDFFYPDRIVIGAETEYARHFMTQLYADFGPMVYMSRRSAELTKYAANALLATKISFINEMALLAEAVNADIESVREGLALDPRIGPHFIKPGPGYGGSCFPKDVTALIHIAQQAGTSCRLVEVVHAVNESQKNVLFNKLYRYYKGDLSQKIIAIWGLAFKPNTDDMREAPSLPFIKACLTHGATVQAFDPEAGPNAQRLIPQLHLANSPEAALKGAHVLVLLTEWAIFKQPDFALIAAQLTDKTLFDGRNLYDPPTVQAHGLYYEGIGRRKTVSTILKENEVSS